MITRLLPVAAALAMPTIAFFSQRGAFGPDNGAISNRYPTLLVAEGYAFAIWSLIFTLALAYALWQVKHGNTRTRAAVTIGYALTAAWMVVFSQQWFWLALAVIWGSLAALLFARFNAPAHWLPKWALGLHAGWVSLAVFLNTAQVIVAYELLPVANQLPWSLLLWALAGALVLWANQRQGGHLAYPLAALWGLVGVVVKQSGQALPGADASAIVAAMLALLVVAQTAWLLRRQPHLRAAFA